MSTKTAYSYVVLRYVHDITTGEFLNVGVALHAPSQRFLGAQCRSTYGRLSKAFPGVNGDHFRGLMRHVQERFEALSQRLREELPLGNSQSVMDFAREVLPADDGSLQWSQPGSGQTTDPVVTLERLFDRMVNRYEDRGARERRTEDDVWRHFRRSLEAHHLLRHFEPRTIAVEDDEYEFKHTWKNGVVHCLEPISFDLASAEGMQDKVHRWLGRMTSIRSSREKFRMYFLVGGPQDETLISAYEKALSVLKKAPVDQEIITEARAEELARELAEQVEQHDRHPAEPLRH